MRHYLTIRTGTIPKIGKVYEEFKSYFQRKSSKIDSILADMRDFAKHYCAMALGGERELRLAAAFRDLREFRVGGRISTSSRTLPRLHQPHAHA